MELFNDKKVIELIQELKRALRTRGLENEELPKFVFICGERILDDNGHLIPSAILEKENNIRFLAMNKLSKHIRNGIYGKKSNNVQCIISEYLYKSDKPIDILTFEEVLAEISEYIIIIVESPGTYCELGAFALHDAFASKTIVINEDNPKYKNSFITLGPIKKIEKKNENNIILHNGKSTLKTSLQFNDMIKNIANQKVKFMPNINSEEIKLKNLIYEFLNIIELLEPITPYELEMIYKEIREIETYTILNKDKHKIISLKKVINLMEDMKIIHKINGYYFVDRDITSYNAMFKLERKEFNVFRTEYMCRVYRREPERMKGMLKTI